MTRCASHSPGIGRADGDLDVLRRPLAEEQVVLAPGEGDDVLVHLVAADADAAADTTMPPRLMTATSVVPPPMSTMSEPDGSPTGRPAPIAAAIGSSMSPAQRAPALSAASRTARFSTSVTPDGMPSSIRGRGIMPTRSWTLSTKYLIICSVTSKSLMTPSRSGRTAMMLAGVRPTIRLASAPTASTRLVLASMATTDGSLMTMPAIADVDQRVGRPEVDPDVAGEDAEDPVEHVAGGSFVRRGRGFGGRGAGAGRRRRSRGGPRGGIHSPGRAGSPRSIPGRPWRGRRAAQSAARARVARPVERHAPVAQRDVRVVADDEVVEQLDVEQPAGRQRLGGQVEVVRRRRRVARRVVVDEDDAGRVEPDRVAEELADPDQRRRHVALVDGRHAQDVVLRVEHHDPQLLALEPAHLEDQPVGHVVRAADRPARGRPVRQQPAPELERRHELGGLRLADPVDLGQLELRGAGQTGQAVMAGERVRGEVDRRSAARPRAPDEADQLGRGQPTDAPHGQPLARPLRGPGSSRIARPVAGCRRLLAGSWDAATAAPPERRRAVEASPGPNDGSPPIPPAIRTSRTTQSLARALIGRSIRGCTAAHPAGRCRQDRLRRPRR